MTAPERYPTLYLHIGYHKTGTSTIQAFLARNEERLRDFGYLYPQSTRAGSSHAKLANSFKPENYTDSAVDLWRQILDEIMRKGANSAIVSSECFLEDVSPYKIGEILLQFPVNVKVVVFLRRQDRWLESLYNEVVRDPWRRETGSIYDLREYVSNAADYSAELERWAKVFGRENMIVRPFARSQMPRGLVPAFLGAIGLEAGVDEDWYTNQSDESNTSLAYPVLMTLRVLNQVPMVPAMHMELVAALVRLSSAPASLARPRNSSIFTNKERAEILRRYSVCNEQIANYYLHGQIRHLFTDVGLDNEHEEPSTVGQADMRMIFEDLPEHIKVHCRQMRPQVRWDRPDEFIANPPAAEIQRLRDTTLRQRIEMRWTWRELGNRRRFDQRPDSLLDSAIELLKPKRVKGEML